MDGNFVGAIESDCGRIASVSGSQVIVFLNPETPDRQRGARSPLVKGTLVKIPKDTACVYGLVTAVSVPMPTADETDVEMQFAEVVLLGEVEAAVGGRGSKGFERGVSLFPSVGDRIFVSTAEDLALVYAKPASGSVAFGTIHQDRSIPAYLVPDLLLGKHFAVLGTTGSGKSCATALILRRIVEAHPGAHVVVLDPHNEYAAAFGDLAEVIDSTSLDLPYWLFSFEELSAAILGSRPSAGEERPEEIILAELVLKAKKAFAGNLEKTGQITVNTPIPYKMSDVLDMIEKEMGALSQNKNTSPFLRLKTKINLLRNDSSYAFMFGGISICDNMAKILSRMFRVPVEGKPITILDLSAIPSDVLNIVVSVLSRITFDMALFSDRGLPILLVCEEAHRYLSNDPTQGFEPTRRILSRIAKEGRKYGVALGIISQRPSDLATSALCQCNTVFALRLTGQTDQNIVRAMLPDWGGGLLDFLPSLRNGEAIAVGEGVSVPARVRFDILPPEQMPRSATARFSTAWRHQDLGEDMLTDIIERWRHEQ
jgi:hypothetical protein